MMITIKQGLITLLLYFVVFFFMPVVSYASSTYPEFSSDGESADSALIEFDSLVSPWTYDVDYVNYSSNGKFDYSGSIHVLDSTAVRVCFYWDKASGSTLMGSYAFYNGSKVDTAFVKNQARFSGTSSGPYSSKFIYYNRRGNIPIFDCSLADVRGSGSLGFEHPAYKWLVSGELSDTLNVIGYGASEPASGSSLGYIKNVNYSHNNNTSSQGLYEVVSWGPTSTTGIDLTEKITYPGGGSYDRYRVEFALRDQSTIAKNSFYTDYNLNYDKIMEWKRQNTSQDVLPFDINTIVSRLAGGLAGGLAEHVYPYGGTNRAIKKGLITTAPSYNKMVSMGDLPASTRRYAFNALHEYTTSENFAAEAPEIHSSLTGVYNTNLPNFLKGGWFESIVSNSNYYNIADYHLSYNIYARIVDTKDKVNGNWLLIDKHGQPIGAEDDRMKGGYTSRPIKLPDFNPGTDWTDAPDDVDVPDDEIEDNDTVKDEPLGTGYDDGSDNSGSGTTNIYNNYTYNYDNRSWIENHYDNETVQDANEGIDWLKLFSGFFSIFLILFGPFLPEWAVVLVTVATPIILGLAIFKVIKGIIPFV